MFEIKYYKDLSHNYLILKTKSDGNKENYHLKMITSNQIKGLLSCNIRYMNDEVYFYFDISSKQSIKILFDKKEIGYEQLYHLLDFINETSARLNEYMLEDSRILLYPEYIYSDPETKEYYFLYYPYELSDNTGMEAFAAYLVEKVEHTDDKAVVVAYDIYEHVRNKTFLLSPFLHGMEPPGELLTEEILQKTESADGFYASGQEEQAEYLYDEDYPEEVLQGEKSQRTNKMITVVFLVLCMLSDAGILCLRLFYELSWKESLLSAAGLIGFTTIAIMLLLFLLRFAVRNKNKREGSVLLQQSDSEVMNTRNTSSLFAPEPDYKNMDSKREVFAERDQEDTYGNTIFMEEAICKNENKLYGTNKGNKYHIDLNQIPCTVGKLAGGVDAVIKDETISRIHARFTKEETQFYLTDLNSTNGTFKNGLRLEPNETIAVEPGDEIRFGKMTFSFR